MDNKIRYVRCAKCLKVLKEMTNVPVYQCGGCGALLQSKYYCPPKDNGTSKPNGLQGNGSSDNEKALQDQIASSLNPESSDVACSEDQSMPSTLSSTPKGEASEEEGISSKEAVSKTGQLNFRSISENMDERHSENIQVEMENCSNEKIEDSSKYKHHDNESPLLCDKLKEVPSTMDYTIDSEQDECILADNCLNEASKVSSNVCQPSSSTSVMSDSPVSVIHNVASKEESRDRVHEERQGECLLSPSKSPQSYDDSLSSIDDKSRDYFPGKYLLSPTGGFRHHRTMSSVDSRVKGEAKAFIDYSLGAYSASELLDHKVKSLNKNHMHRFSSNKEASSSSNYQISRQEQGISEDSANYYSVQHWLDSECPTGTVSRSTTFKGDSRNYESGTKLENIGQDNSVLLRKVHELRHQLSKMYVERDQKSMSQNRVPVSLNHNLGQNSSQYLNPKFVQHSGGSYYSPSTNVPVPQHYRSDKSCSCSQCHLEEHHLNLHPNMYHSGPCGSCAYNMPTCSSSATNVRTSSDRNTLMHNHGVEKLVYKEKKTAFKRHCRPLSGGAPFVICDECMELLQLPADFLISSTKKQKLKCGGCSKVLLLSFQSSAHTTKIPSKGLKLKLPSDFDNGSSAPIGNKISLDGPETLDEGDRVSFSVDYGLSFSQSCSSDTVPDRNASSSRERKAQGSPNFALHRLMGYSTATEILCKPDDFDEVQRV